MGCSQGTRGQQGPAAATTAGCSGNSGASPWEPANGGNPRSCWGEGSIAASCSGQASHPQVCSAAAETSLCLADIGSAQSQLSCTSPTISLATGWIQKRLPMRWGRAELFPAVPMVQGGSKGGDPHAGHGLSLQWCLGRGQAWHVQWRGGRRASSSHLVPLFLTPVSVRMVHAALCNADADEGKVPFSTRVSAPSHPHPTSVSLCVPINLLPPPPAPVSPCLSGCIAAVSPSRDMSPCGVAQSLRGPWIVVLASVLHTRVALGSALQQHKAIHPYLLLDPKHLCLLKPQNTCSHCAHHPQPTLWVPKIICLETLPIFGGALPGPEPPSPPFSWEEAVCTARVGSESRVPAGLQPGGTLLCHLQAPAQGHPAALHLLPPGPR